MLKLDAKDVYKFLKENDLKNVEAARNADYRDLIFHGVLTTCIRGEEKKYMKQGFLLSVLGSSMAILSTATFPVALGTVGAIVGAINIYNSAKGVSMSNKILKTLTMTLNMFNEASPEDCDNFVEKMTREDFDAFLDRTYFCKSEM